MAFWSFIFYTEGIKILKVFLSIFPCKDVAFFFHLDENYNIEFALMNMYVLRKCLKKQQQYFKATQNNTFPHLHVWQEQWVRLSLLKAVPVPDLSMVISPIKLALRNLSYLQLFTLPQLSTAVVSAASLSNLVSFHSYHSPIISVFYHQFLKRKRRIRELS